MYIYFRFVAIAILECCELLQWTFSKYSLDPSGVGLIWKTKLQDINSQNNVPLCISCRKPMHLVPLNTTKGPQEITLRSETGANRNIYILVLSRFKCPEVEQTHCWGFWGPAGWAHLPMGLHKLKRLHQTKRLVWWTAHRQVVHTHVLHHTIWINDEQASEA